MMYTALVPARSGSKRLPGKNVRLLGGKPLLVWSLEACVRCDAVEKVIFSTDSVEYWELARLYISSDKLVFDHRKSEDAGDNIKIFDYLKQGVDKTFSGCHGRFIMCLPTMPLRNAEHIKEAISLCESSGKGVFSAVEYDAPTSFAFTVEESGEWKPVFSNSPMVTGNTRSQDQLKTYHPNGAIYIRDIDDLRKPDLFTLYQDALPFLMDKSGSVDIDTIEDFQMAELALANLKS